MRRAGIGARERVTRFRSAAAQRPGRALRERRGHNGSRRKRCRSLFRSRWLKFGARRAVKVNGLPADRRVGKALDRELARRGAETGTQVRRFGQRVDGSPPAPADRRAAPAGRFRPCRTISRQPGTSVATIGRPQAAASSRFFGMPSCLDGSTAIWARAQTVEMPRTCPSHVTPGRCDQLLASASVSESGLAGSGVPAISSSTSEPRARSNCVSRQRRRECPCRPSRRPTKATVGGPAGSGSGVSAVDVDAGAGDQRNLRRCDAERDDHGRGRLRSAPARPNCAAISRNRSAGSSTGEHGRAFARGRGESVVQAPSAR